MYDIHVFLKNAPDELAALGMVLGQNGIGLEGGSVFIVGEKAHAHFLVEKGDAAKVVLEKAGLQVESVCRPLIRKLKQNYSALKEDFIKHHLQLALMEVER